MPNRGAPLARGSKLTRERAHADTIRCLAFATDQRRLVSAGNDMNIKVWSVADLTPVHTMRDEYNVQAVARSPFPPLIASANELSQVKLWSPDSGELVHPPRGHIRMVRAVAFSPDGKNWLPPTRTMSFAYGMYAPVSKCWRCRRSTM
jgi:WD40 repeat protein